MNIRLMTNVKNQAVLHGIVNRLNGNAEFNRTQVSGQMSAGFGYILDQKFPNLPAELGPLLVV